MTDDNLDNEEMDLDDSALESASGGAGFFSSIGDLFKGKKKKEGGVSSPSNALGSEASSDTFSSQGIMDSGVHDADSADSGMDAIDKGVEGDVEQINTQFEDLDAAEADEGTASDFDASVGEDREVKGNFDSGIIEEESDAPLESNIGETIQVGGDADEGIDEGQVYDPNVASPIEEDIVSEGESFDSGEWSDPENDNLPEMDDKTSGEDVKRGG